MKVCGLTGGVGMGKSTTADFFRSGGVPVVDTDQLARQLVQPGEPALAEIQSQFGYHLISSDGQLRREVLAEIVFADPSDRLRLEAILHPRIRAAWLAQIETWRAENHPLAVVVIPLLFETHAEPQFDQMVCVACSARSQRERLADRSWDTEQINRRLAAQLPIEQKVARAHFVVWTEGSLDSHAQQVVRVRRSL